MITKHIIYTLFMKTNKYPMLLILLAFSFSVKAQTDIYDVEKSVSKKDFMDRVEASQKSTERIFEFEMGTKSYPLILSSVTYEGLVVAANLVTENIDAHLFVSLNRYGKMDGYFYDSKEGFGVRITEQKEELIFKTLPVDEVVDLGHYDDPREHKKEQKTAYPSRMNNTTMLDTAAAWNALQSLPGATDVIYLDFDGGKVYETSWNNRFDADTLYVEGRIFPDGTSNGFSQEFIKEVWLEVAEDFLPFKVNVTTDSSVYHSKEDFERLICIFAREVEGWGNENFDGDYPAGVAAAVDAYAEIGRAHV